MTESQLEFINCTIKRHSEDMLVRLKFKQYNLIVTLLEKVFLQFLPNSSKNLCTKAITEKSEASQTIDSVSLNGVMNK